MLLVWILFFWSIPLSFLSNGSGRLNAALSLCRDIFFHFFFPRPRQKKWRGACPRLEPAAHPMSTGAVGTLGSWGGVGCEGQRTKMGTRSPWPGLLLGSEQAIATWRTCSTEEPTLATPLLCAGLGALGRPWDSGPEKTLSGCLGCVRSWGHV